MSNNESSKTPGRNLPFRGVTEKLISGPRQKLFELSIASAGHLAIARAELKTGKVLGKFRESNLTEKFEEILSFHPEVGPQDKKERYKWVKDHGIYLELKLTELFIDDDISAAFRGGVSD